MSPQNAHKGTVQPPKSANSRAICDICGKRLARHSDMPRHKRLHDPKPDRWMHWCPEPGCDYGSMQRSNLRNHIRKHTGQRLLCPDDSTCNYATFDKSALLRHRQRRHGYQTKPTAAKDRCMKVTEKRTSTTRKLDNPSIDRSSNSHSEPVPDFPCPCLSASTSNHRDIVDERDLWQDDHDPPQETAIEQPVEPIEQSPDEYVTSRFPVSFARTRLPHATNAPSASKHRRRCTCNLRSNSVVETYSNGIGPDAASRPHRGAKVKEVFVYRRSSYLLKEAVFLATC